MTKEYTVIAQNHFFGNNSGKSTQTAIAAVHSDVVCEQCIRHCRPPNDVDDAKAEIQHRWPGSEVVQVIFGRLYDIAYHVFEVRIDTTYHGSGVTWLWACQQRVRRSVRRTVTSAAMPWIEQSSNAHLSRWR